MGDTQLELFDLVHPFRRRWSIDFFRTIPRQPGVYWMTGRWGVAAAAVRVLYVGKAKDLRARLLSYRSTGVLAVSRKTRRLLTCVEAIGWETCESEQAALLRENAMIQRLRPPFNRAQVRPQDYWYVGLRRTLDHWTWQLAHEPAATGEWFGAYKSRAGYSAVARLLQTVGREGLTWRSPDAAWFRQDPPRRLSLGRGWADLANLERKWLPLIQDFLKGKSDRLLVEYRALADSLGGAFERGWLEQDYQLLGHFYQGCAVRNARVAQQHGLSGGLVPKGCLDELLLRDGMKDLGSRRTPRTAIDEPLSIDRAYSEPPSVAGPGGGPVNPGDLGGPVRGDRD